MAYAWTSVAYAANAYDVSGSRENSDAGPTPLTNNLSHGVESILQFRLDGGAVDPAPQGQSVLFTDHCGDCLEF